MEFIVAKNSGFCFGVRRSLQMLELELSGGPLYTFGHIIHNEDVVSELSRRGAVPISDLEALHEGDTLVIRAHGAPPEVFALCEERGIRVVDATCPFVSRIHVLARECFERGVPVVIVGTANHPEVVGIAGWARSRLIAADAGDAQRLPAMPKAAVVVQTTFNEAAFEGILSILREKIGEIELHNTICDTTRKRQTEAEAIARRADAVVVMGDRNSANTRNLYELCRRHCEKTQYIENPGQFFLENVAHNGIIGLIAGASTPDWMIREVVTKMNEQELKAESTMEAVETQEAAAVAPAADQQERESDATQSMAALESVEVDQPSRDEQSEAQADDTPAEESVIQANDTPAGEDEAQTGDASEPSFMEAFEKTMVRIRNGQIVKGTVVQISDDEVCVNIGYKSDGLIPKNEFSSDPSVSPTDVFKVGDEIEVEVLKVNDGEGNVLLSRKSIEGRRLWDEILENFDPEAEYEGMCREVVKGGLIAIINGVRAFVPASQVSVRFVENLSEYVGKPMRLRILEVDKAKKRIVASQKAVLLSDLEAKKKEKWGKLVVGERITGTVRRLTDFGAFVDIGGIDGLVHVTDMAWGRVKNPADVLSVGQEIEVLIQNVDTEKQRVSLGYKQLQPKPWAKAGEKYPVGTVVEGRVVRIVPFGAFVSLEPTIDGLIHISQVATKRIAKVEDEIQIGDIVKAKVLEVQPEAKRISLSRREALIDEMIEMGLDVEEILHPTPKEQPAPERPKETQEKPEKQERPARSERAPRERAPRERRDEHDHRGGRGERVELPPVQQTTTSLADKFPDMQALMAGLSESAAEKPKEAAVESTPEVSSNEAQTPEMESVQMPEVNAEISEEIAPAKPKATRARKPKAAAVVEEAAQEPDASEVAPEA